MNQSDIPARFPIPWANSARGSCIRPIPTPSQTPSTTDAPASLTDGFRPENFTNLSAGGIPPNGADFNGILNWVTKSLRWLQAGAPAIFDSAFSTAVGGYPKGAKLDSLSRPGVTWFNTVDGNTTDPDGGSASGWVAMSAAGVATAWCRWNSSGVIAASHNFASVTVNSAGDYSLAFATAMKNANYAIIGMGSDDNTGTVNSLSVYPAALGGTDPTTAGFRLIDTTGSITVSNDPVMSVVIYGGI